MDPIIIAVLIVGGLGLLCSLLLVVATHFFRIKEEEKFIKIREALPGVNCGACGFTGCDQYAKALSVGEAEPNLCIPGSTSVAKTLSEILGIEIIVDEPKGESYGSVVAAPYAAQIFQGIIQSKQLKPVL